MRHPALPVTAWAVQHRGDARFNSFGVADGLARQPNHAGHRRMRS
jgi:hypothetical protein